MVLYGIITPLPPPPPPPKKKYFKKIKKMKKLLDTFQSYQLTVPLGQFESVNAEHLLWSTQFHWLPASRRIQYKMATDGLLLWYHFKFSFHSRCMRHRHGGLVVKASAS